MQILAPYTKIATMSAHKIYRFLKLMLFFPTRSGVKAALVLMPLLGITWVFGLFSVNAKTVVFQYLFAIFNSLQVRFV